MEAFYVGQQIKIDATFTNLAGDVTDPTTITAKLRSPDGTITTYVYGTDAALTKVSTGLFRLLYTVAEEGEHHWRMLGTGAVIAAVEGTFVGRESQFN